MTLTPPKACPSSRSAWESSTGALAIVLARESTCTSHGARASDTSACVVEAPSPAEILDRLCDRRSCTCRPLVVYSELLLCRDSTSCCLPAR